MSWHLTLIWIRIVWGFEDGHEEILTEIVRYIIASESKESISSFYISLVKLGIQVR